MAASAAETIGIVGAGKLGRTLARLSLAAGLSVVIHGSGPLARTARVLESFDIAATPASLDEVTAADIVVLAIPLSDAEVLDGSLFDRTIVVDPMNHWDEADGPRPDFDDPSTPTSMLVQRWFDRARVVKAFNHVAYKDLAGGARVSGDPHRWGVAVAANDADAGTTVAAWVDAVGFDPVMVGSLAATYALQPGQPLFGATLSAAALETLLR
ncbi:NAD(P)-binding domain-containing protein [Microbacterium sp. NC79]|nr:NAD(P)-binding domain-containing protein [Microbacterium sp. NC79]